MLVEGRWVGGWGRWSRRVGGRGWLGRLSRVGVVVVGVVGRRLEAARGLGGLGWWGMVVVDVGVVVVVGVGIVGSARGGCSPSGRSRRTTFWEFVMLESMVERKLCAPGDMRGVIDLEVKSSALRRLP